MNSSSRRHFLSAAGLAAALPIHAEAAAERILFDGRTLQGWHAVPRLPMPRHPGAPQPSKDSEAYKRALSSRGRWQVRDGAITGGQEPPASGLGGYLLTDETFGDFELSIDANPDWGVDTGVMVRSTSLGSQGFQIHVDHRTMGSIGTFYGNGIGGFRARQFAFLPKRDAQGKVIGLEPADVPAAESSKLARAAAPRAFFDSWRFGQWNTLTIRVAGNPPRITTFINGVKLAELDGVTLKADNYDAQAVAHLLGACGHIGVEVHNSGGADPLAQERWLPNAVCRWKNIRIRSL